MLDKEYLKIIEYYKANPKDIDAVRIYLFSRVYDIENIVEYIDYFKDCSISLNDIAGEAMAMMMYFWAYYKTDFELAHDYNTKALKLYHSLNDYTLISGYFDVLANEIIYNNYKGELYNCYKLLLESIALCDSHNLLNYHSIFTIIGVYFLCDIDLYDKARELLSDLKSNSKILSKPYYYVINNIETKILVYEGKYDLALNNALEQIKKNDEEKVLPSVIPYCNLLDVYSAMNDNKNAQKCYLHLLDDLKEEQTVINQSICLSFARYFKMIKDFEKAHEYYLKCFKSNIKSLGDKLSYINECVDIFDQQNDHENYLLALKEYNNILKQSVEILKDINNSNTLKVEEINNTRYKYAYLKVEEITHFVKELNIIEKIDELYSFFSNKLNSILKTVSSKLLLIDYDNELIEKINSLTPIKVIEEKIFTLRIADIYESNENSDNVAYIVRIINEKEDFLGYLILESGILSDVGELELIYIIRLINEILGPTIYRIIRYNSMFKKYNKDQLTGCYNRYGLDDVVSAYFASSDKPLTYIMIDIDDFKQINDMYGHQCGDNVLKSLVSILKDFFKDYVFRVGGEEFVALTTYSDKNKKMLDKLIKTISKSPVEYENKSVYYTVSIGASILKNSHIKMASLEADNKLYVSKNNGKNQFNM